MTFTKEEHRQMHVESQRKYRAKLIASGEYQKYQQTEVYKQSKRKWQAEHCKQQKVWRMVNRAINSGLLIRQPCEICGSHQSMAHHNDYNRPFDIRWLCDIHHKQYHQNGN